MGKEPQQTLPEEIANSITHGIGAALSIAGLSVLVALASMKGDAWRIVSFSVYGSTLVILYLASTLYHSFQSPRIKHWFRKLDHVSIYLLIAGTYTPFALVNMRGTWGWILFGLTWGIAAFGVLFKTFFVGRCNILSTALYIAMGWTVLIALKPAVAVVPLGGIGWMLAGGLLYTFGVIFYAWERLPFNHTVWHLFVLGGSVCHFFGIVFFVLPAHAG